MLANIIVQFGETRLYDYVLSTDSMTFQSVPRRDANTQQSHIVLIITNMKFIVLALGFALVAVSTNSIVQGCGGHGYGHDHKHNERHSENDKDTDLSDEDSPNGLSSEIDGRRTVSRFRVGNYNWGTREAFEAAGARCVSSKPSLRQVEQSDEILNDYRKRSGSNRRLAPTVQQIPVYFHVIKPSNGRGGDVSDAQIIEQIAVLNAAFRGVAARQGDFEFTYKGKTTTQSNSYYGANIGTNAERQMKSSLRQGGTNALNIYTMEPYVHCVYVERIGSFPLHIRTDRVSWIINLSHCSFFLLKPTEVVEYWAGPHSPMA
jgi:hypothetical protein